ncbi:uncharacterized protein LOC121467365 [Drosophila elegans]|uniref:uncharacterized protein LOC121467365 n=1 Tax=Drosophila elegans TaxID=30023 RepID=UPI001BC8482C|nr:uncharacterized protein LOC121467365 [Drosophila elegans]
MHRNIGKERGRNEPRGVELMTMLDSRNLIRHSIVNQREEELSLGPCNTMGLALGTSAPWDFGTCRSARCLGLGLGHVDDDPPIVRCTFRSGCCQQVGPLDD